MHRGFKYRIVCHEHFEMEKDTAACPSNIVVVDGSIALTTILTSSIRRGTTKHNQITYKNVDDLEQ